MQLKYLLASLLCALASAASPQWVNPQSAQPARDNNGNPIQYDSQSRPIERRFDNNGNPITENRQSNSANCRVIIDNPIHMELAITKGTCGSSGLVEGQQTVSGTVIGSPNNITVEIMSAFVEGRPTGRTVFDSTIRMSFVGEMFLDGRSIGYNTSPNGQIYNGEMRNGQLWAGELTSPSAQGSRISYYLRNKVVSASEYSQSVSAESGPEPKRFAPPADKAPQPEEPSLDNTETTSGRTIGQPPCYMELPLLKAHSTFSGSYPGRCIEGKYHGKAILSIAVPSDPDDLPQRFIVNIKEGKQFGVGILSLNDDAVVYTGTFKKYFPWNGVAEAMGERGSTVRDTFKNGVVIPYQQSTYAPKYVEYIPPAASKSPSLASKENGNCFADRPTDRYFVTGKFPGECKSGKYSGTAELTLSPKDPHDPIVKLTARYLDGALSGPVKAVYPQYALTYRGSFDGFVVGTGLAEQPIGNRTFDITEYRSGEIVSTRTEYRPPSELELVLIDAAGRFGERLGTQLGREIDGAAGRQREQRRLARTEAQRQQDIARANDITRQEQTSARPNTSEGQIVPQQEPEQLPVQVARVEPQPVFVADTNQPEFGGDARPQGDPPLITTEPQGVPAPHPTASTIHEPVRRVEPSIPAPQPAVDPIPSPVPVNGLPAPIRPIENEVPPPLAPATRHPDFSQPPVAPPVQGGGQNDTLGTGPVPSNPAPQPVPETVNRPAPTPEVNPNSPAQPTVSRATVPSIPTGLYPTNQGELRLPIPLGWQPVSGATRYRITVKDQTDNYFPVDDVFTTQNPYTVDGSRLRAGHSFTWDVAACNAAGCSGRSANGSFRTGGGFRNDTCNIEVRFKPVFHISNHAFIITSDGNSVTYFRGGPESRESVLSDRLLRDVSNFVFGRIITETGSYSPGTPDWVSTPSGRQTVAILQSSCDEIDRIFGRYMADIERASTTYNPLYKNSNSVIREVLERAGYGYVTPVVTATAWNSQLP